MLTDQIPKDILLFVAYVEEKISLFEQTQESKKITKSNNYKKIFAIIYSLYILNIYLTRFEIYIRMV